MILIAGATGMLGSQIVTNLAERGEQLRLVTRPGSPPPHAANPSVEHVIADLKDPRSLRRACEGIDTVVTTANAAGRQHPDTLHTVDDLGNANLIRAAEETEVRRFLFVSALGAHPDHPMPLLAAKGASERRLKESHLEWTILQPDTFMDLLIPLVVARPALAGQPVLLVGSGQRKHSYVASADVAAYATAALTHPAAINQTITIGGPTPLSWHDIVTAFEETLHRSLPIHHIAPGEVLPGLPEFVSHLLTALDTYDSTIDMRNTSTTYDVNPTDISQYVRTLLRARTAPAA